MNANTISKINAILDEQREYDNMLGRQRDEKTLDYGLYLKFLNASKKETALLIYQTIMEGRL